MFDGQQLGEDVVAIVRSFMEREIAPLKARIAELEARQPEKGDPGERGEKGDPGNDGAAGADGKDGRDGADGRGIKDLLIDREGCLVAAMGDGEMKNIGLVVGKDGKRGKDGRDGLDLSSFDAQVCEDDRTIELKFVAGDEEHVASFKWPTPIYRGTYQHEREYEAGDVVTWGGHMWIAERATTGKPDQPDVGWRLAVKRGRDGKDARA